MTENIEALVAEACEFLSGENAQYYDAALVKALTDALEAEHKRAEELRAVIERVKAYLRANGLPVEASEFAGMDEWERGFTLAGDRVLGILNTAPVDALRAVKAEAWEQGADATCAAYAIVRTRGYMTNPYRGGTA